MRPASPESSGPPQEGGGLEKLARQGRVEYRMVTDDQPLSDDVRRQIVEEISAYRHEHPRAGQPLAWGRLAERIGIAQGTLVDVVRGRYKGDTDRVLRKIDQFLADERSRRGRCDFHTPARIGVTEAIFGTIRSGIRNNTMPVIIGSPGVGKTVHARAFAAERSGVLLIRADEAHRDARGVTRLICNAADGLRQHYRAPHARRVLAIKQWLAKHLTTVIVVDEAQKLVREGLEMLRDLHDLSDPAGRRNIPVVFFGDHRFKRLLFTGRTGDRSPISPQIARRMRPVLDIDADCRLDEDGAIYTADDIVRIVRNNRVKLLTPAAVRWLRDLANVQGYGRLGFAIGVLQLAVDLASAPDGAFSGQITVDLLQQALEMTFGRSVAIEIDEQTGGELLRRAV